jgi:hypothetical protein
VQCQILVFRIIGPNPVGLNNTGYFASRVVFFQLFSGAKISPLILPGQVGDSSERVGYNNRLFYCASWMRTGEFK